MRSPKSRSRSKNNRSRSLGNVANRVFDSSGPEGKVRGTPQQIIDKYNQLARDAQLSNDRVAAENFQQHAEHYLRMLAEVQREMEARREQADRDRQEQQSERRGRHGDAGEGDEAADTPKALSPEKAPEPESQSDDMLVKTPEGAASSAPEQPAEAAAEAPVEEAKAKPAKPERRASVRVPRGGTGRARRKSAKEKESEEPAAAPVENSAQSS